MKELAEYILSNDYFIIVGHKEPDGDSIGSMMAMKRFLKNIGKQAIVIFEEQIHIPIAELGIDESYYTRHDLPSLEKYSHLIMLDAHQWYRIGALEEVLRPAINNLICIDHHPNNDPEGMINYIDSNAAAVGEIIYKLIVFMDKVNVIDNTIARCIYLSIYSDTGGFKFSNTKKETHELVAHLYDYDINPYHMYSVLNEQRTLPQLRLVAKALETLRLVYNDQIGYIVVSKDILESTQTTLDDIRNFTYYPRSIKTVRIALVFIEKDSSVDIAFRSNGSIAVNTIAHAFGGGGHPNAAGAEVADIVLEELVVEVLHACQKALTQEEISNV